MMMKKRYLRLFLFSISSFLYGYIIKHFFFDTLALIDLTPPLILMMMDPSSSSSSLPNPEASVNQEAPNPEPPEPDLSQPLLDDNTRRAELDERAGFHLVGLSDSDREKVLNFQVIIERKIEKALLSDGYSRDELSQLTKRDEIRGLLFYPNGKLMSLQTYQKYVREVEFGTQRSKPYKKILNALSSSHLFLTKVKKIKRWELGKVWEQWGGRR